MFFSLVDAKGTIVKLTQNSQTSFNSVQCDKIPNVSDDDIVMPEPAKDIELDDINRGQDPTEPLNATWRFCYMDVNAVHLNHTK